MKTPERVAAAQAMRARGARFREIAEHFGVSVNTVQDWVKDPNLARSRARKESYAAPCVDCDAPTSGSEGRREEPRCGPCAHRHIIASGERADMVRRVAKCQRIVALWHDGRTIRQIAAALDTTPGTIGVEITRMRREGWDVPYRHRGYGSERQAA